MTGSLPNQPDFPSPQRKSRDAVGLINARLLFCDLSCERLDDLLRPPSDLASAVSSSLQTSVC